MSRIILPPVNVLCAIVHPAISPPSAFIFPSKYAEPEAHNPNPESVLNFGDVIPARLPVLTTAEPLEAFTSIKGLLAEEASIVIVPPFTFETVPPVCKFDKSPEASREAQAHR